MHFGARYYDPTTQRWTQVDPLGPGITSGYAYSDNNPTNETDPSGECGHSLNGTYGRGYLVHVYHVWCHASYRQVVENMADLVWYGAIGAAIYLLAAFLDPVFSIGAIAISVSVGYIVWQLSRSSWDPNGEWYNYIVTESGWWYQPWWGQSWNVVWFWASPY